VSDRLTILQGDCLDVLQTLPSESVHTCVTSPPYWGLRDYGVAGQIGLERTPKEYVAKMVAVFQEVRRVLRGDGTCWVNLGDTYAQNGGPGWQGKNGQRADRRFTATRDTVGMREAMRRPPGTLKPKDMVGIPWRVAFALRADGWYLRSDIIWYKPNPMPESVTDRPTKAHEYLFLLSKSERYAYDAEAIAEPVLTSRLVCGGNGKSWHDHKDDLVRGNRVDDQSKKFTAFDGKRNKRTVWTIPSAPFSDAHFATFPPDLIKPCILAGCPVGGTVLDPFGGSGTTGMVALELGRKAILIELNPAYVEMQRQRCDVTPGLAL
jgi:DNA modification methylase